MSIPRALLLFRFSAAWIKGGSGGSLHMLLGGPNNNKQLSINSAPARPSNAPGSTGPARLCGPQNPSAESRAWDQSPWPRQRGRQGQSWDTRGTGPDWAASAAVGGREGITFQAGDPVAVLAAECGSQAPQCPCQRHGRSRRCRRPEPRHGAPAKLG